MTTLTLEGIQGVLADAECGHIVSLLRELSVIPQEQIKIPFAIAFPIMREDKGTFIRMCDLLDPATLTARVGEKSATHVRSLEYFALLIRSVSAANLRLVDRGAQTVRPQQFYVESPG